ncbi:exodeoxyribonuclease V subunit beta [Salmonella enterica]|nr:exodeoxyribonuclease V subunit beta [Salmonella enterica]
MTYFFNRKSDYIKSLSGEEINSLQKDFEEACFFMSGFNSDKNELGDYKDGGTQAAWEGYMFSEEWNKHGRYQKTSLPECPEPLDGWCDCGKCKAMRLHKTKNIYVCLVCHKQTEPFLPVDFNSNDWLP